jgi:hypothetical protein
MLRRTFLVATTVVAALTILLASTVPAGAAIRPFDPPQTVVGGCRPSSADAVVGPDGGLTGFASCPSPSGLLIRFFSRSADGTVNPSQNSGFTGSVLAVAADETATYVMYVNGIEIRVGKRTTAGVFTSRGIDAWYGDDFPTGDIIARDGRWTGVWSRQTGPAGGPTRLFQAGSTSVVSWIHSVTSDVSDHLPTLAYSGATPVLIWVRSVSTQPGSDLMVSKRMPSGGWEGPRRFATAGTDNLAPDMAVAGGRTFVTWYRDGFVMVASNAGGSFTSHRFAVGGFGTHVAVSSTGGVVDHAFVTWTATATGRVFFAESATTGTVHGTWEGGYVGPVDSFGWAVGVAGAKATVTYDTLAPDNLVVRSQT